MKMVKDYQKHLISTLICLILLYSPVKSTCLQDCSNLTWTTRCTNRLSSIVFSEYCNLECADNDLNNGSVQLYFATCNDNDNCTFQECCNIYFSNFAYTGGVCAVSGNFYANPSLFCAAYNATIETGEMNCGGLVGCATNLECLQLKCKNDCLLANPNYTNSCSEDITIQTFINVDNFCDSFCLDPSFQVESCQNSSGLPVDCTNDDCKIRECIQSLDSQGYDSETICAEDADFYTSRRNYCLNEDDGNVLDYLLCNSMPCTSDSQCCMKKCLLDNQAYTSTCDNLEFVWHDTAQSWCTAYCANKNKSFCDNAGPCTEEHCFIENCKINNTTYQGSCNVSVPATWTPINTKHDYCQQIWNDPSLVYFCQETACSTNTECAIEKCTSTLNYTNYCSSEANFNINYYFTSKLDYCSSVVINALVPGIQLCNANECPNLELCCEEKCKLESDAPICFENYEWIDNQNDYCEQRCGTLGQQGVQYPALTEDQCCFQKCDSTYTSAQNVCLPDYSRLYTQTEYCLASCPGPLNFKACDPSSPTPCTDAECVITECLQVELQPYSYTQVIGQDGGIYTLYPDHRSYCQAKTATTTFAQIPPNISVVQQYCYLLCIDANPTFNYICQSGFNLFITTESYCREACVAANTSGATIFTEADCGTGVGNCTDVQCCTDKCEAENPNDRCSLTTFALIDNASYCLDTCNNDLFGDPDNNLDWYQCLGPCFASDCQVQQCKAGIENPNPPVFELCGDNNTIYTDAFNYCTQKIKGPEFPNSFNECSTSDCTDECCYVNCLADETPGYVGKCQTSDYLWKDTPQAFCNTKCVVNGGSFNIYICGLINCNEDECCTQQCIVNDDPVVCNVADWSLVPTPTNCLTQCTTGITTFGCGIVDCLQQDCDVQKCIEDVNINRNYTGISTTPICAVDNDKYYASVDAFCHDLLENNDTFTTCTVLNGDQFCANDNDCCEQNCLNAPNFMSGCPTSTYLWTDDKNLWCQWYCPERNLEYYKDPNDPLVHANADQCCHKKCMEEQVYEAGCTLDFTEWVNKDLWCTRQCNDPIYQVFHCASGPCTALDCQVKNCQEDLVTQGYTHPTVCGNNDVFYLSHFDYCVAKQNGQNPALTNFLLCGISQYCQTEAECLKQNCVEVMVLTGNIGVCGLNNEWYPSTFESYCDVYQPNPLASFQFCIPPTDPCDEEECCNKKCVSEGNDFRVCVALFTIDFCPNDCLIVPQTVRKCYNTSSDQINCEFEHCNSFKCQDDLIAALHPQEVCATNGVFYDTIVEYCDAKHVLQYLIDELPCTNCDKNKCCKESCLNGFVIPGSFQPICDNQWTLYNTAEDWCTYRCNATNNLNLLLIPKICDLDNCDQNECCVGGCLASNYNKCDSSFNVVTVEDFCDDNCVFHSGSTYYSCGTENCDVAKCSSIKCQQQLTADLYPHNQVCAVDDNWYTTNKEFCDAGNTGISTEYAFCGNAQQVCSSDYSCCLQNCQTDYGGQVFPVCFVSGGYANNLTEFCERFCPNADPTTIYKNSGGAIASPKECFVYFCMQEPFIHLCKEAGYILYDDQNAYCVARSNGETGFYTCDYENCTEQQCFVKNCRDFLAFASYQGYSICSSDYVYFTSLEAYCINMYQTGGDFTSFLLCNNAPCLSLEQCCHDKCVNDFGVPVYEELCDNVVSEYNPYPTITDFCNAYCPGKAIIAATCGPTNSRFCDKNECCVLKCNSNPYLQQCSLDYTQVVDQIDFCNQQQCQDNFELVKCYDADGVTQIECNDEGCKRQKCLQELIDVNYPFDTVCGRGTWRYDSHYNYCTEIAKGNVFSYIFCQTSQECPNGDQNQNLINDSCCYENCYLDHIAQFTGRCKNDAALFGEGLWFGTVEAFCTELCEKDFQVRFCIDPNNLNTPVPCNKSQCCFADCPLQDPYYDLCATDYSSVLDEAGFCALHCATGLEYLYAALAHDCGLRDCVMDDCEMKACIAQFDNINGIRVCGIDDILRGSVHDYCRDFVDGNVGGFRLCEVNQNCNTAEECRTQNCLNLYATSYDPRCDNKNFIYYHTKETWCAELANVVNFQPYTCGAPNIFCNEEECCLSGCNTEHFDKCNLDTWTVYNSDNTCFDDCRSNIVNLQSCPGRDCTQADCDLMRCNEHLDNFYQGLNLICDQMGNWFTREEYCVAFIQSSFSLTTRLCGGSACLTEKECCVDHCVFFNLNSQVCEAGVFDWFETLAQYCDRACDLQVAGENFQEANDCGGLACDVDTCCEQNCLLDQLYSVCSPTVYNYWSKETLCQEKCNNSLIQPHRCGEPNNYHDCNAAVFECQVKSCVNDLRSNDNYQGDGICGDSRQFYDTLEEYCFELVKTTPSETGFVWCQNPGDECSTEAQCCLHYCNQDHLTTGEVCDSDFFLHPNWASFCDKQCLDININLGFRSCAAQSPTICSEEVCALDKCNSIPYKAECWTNSFPYSLLNQNDFCNHTINVVGFLSQDCGDRDCTEKDCYIKQCLKELDLINYLVDPVCGTNYQYYSTQEEFCAVKYDVKDTAPIFLQQCSGQHCTSPETCCQSNCKTEFALAVFDTCDSDFEPYSSIDEFCMSFCPSRQIEFLDTGCASTYCTKEECCYQECILGIYLGYCDISYIYLTHEQYCTESCKPTSTLLFRKCIFDQCDQEFCLLQQCIDSFANNNYNSVRVCSTLGNFYLTQTLYCNQFKQGLETGYLPQCEFCTLESQCCIEHCKAGFDVVNLFTDRCLTDFIWYDSVDSYCENKCLNNTLNDLYCPTNPTLCNEEQCCITECETRVFVPECDSNYDLITLQNTQCTLQCQSNVTFKCYNGAIPIDCTQVLCQELKCINETAESSVCLDGTTTSYRWLIKQDFCQLIPLPTKVYCDNNPDTCNSENDCCYRNCILDHPGIFDGRCLTGFDPIYTLLNNFCLNKCAQLVIGNPWNVATCQGSSLPNNECSANDCCYEKCLLDNPNDRCNNGFTQMITKEIYCTNICNSQPDDTEACNANCSDRECRILGCIVSLNSFGYISENVCGRNQVDVLNVQLDVFTFYTSQHAYCNDQIDNGQTWVLCYEKFRLDEKACENVTECEIHECRVKNENLDLPFCDFQFNFYDHIFDYCTAFVQNNQIAQNPPCQGAGCDDIQCCEANCLNNNPFNLCRTDNFTVVSNTNFCDLLCVGSVLSVEGCGNQPCLLNDCQLKQCLLLTTDIDVCGSNDTFYQTDDLFCATNFNSGITSNNCSTCQNNDDCCNFNCLDSTEYPGQYCSKDFVWMVDKNKYCDEKCYQKNDISIECSLSGTCNEPVCCQLDCTRQLSNNPALRIPVLVVDSNTQFGYRGYDSACHANCDNAVIDTTCILNQTIQECIDSVVDCTLQCSILGITVNSPDRYCSLNENLSHFEYCELYLCTIGAKYQQNFPELTACNNNSCTTFEQCAREQCLNPCTGTSYVCAAPGQLYTNLCEKNCLNLNAALVANFSCNLNLSICQQQCLQNYCTANCLNQPQSKVCATDKVIYDSQCYLQCIGKTVKFSCESGCSGVRQTHCEFACNSDIF